MKREPPKDTTIRRSPSPAKDLTGKKFGRLTVLRYLGFSKSAWGSYWLCECDCGTVTSVGGKGITRRLAPTQSCGCLKAEDAARRMWRGCGDLSGHYFHHLELRAQRYDYVFSITIEDAWALYEAQEGRCALSGLEIEFGRYAPESRSVPPHHGRPRLNTASLDRINSNEGYTLDNVQWVHKEINRMKGDLDDAEFTELCRHVAAHNPASQDVKPIDVTDLHRYRFQLMRAGP